MSQMFADRNIFFKLLFFFLLIYGHLRHLWMIAVYGCKRVGFGPYGDLGICQSVSFDSSFTSTPPAKMTGWAQVGVSATW
jgi:hypothetical protein